MLARSGIGLLSLALYAVGNAGYAQVSDPDSDWEARSSAEGVFYYNNFDFASTNELISSSYGTFLFPERAQLDTTNKLSGRGAFRANIPRTSGESTVSYRHSFDMPVGSQSKALRKKAFYYQFAIYLPRYILEHRFQTVGGTSDTRHKYAIIMEPDQSFASGEIVITNARFRQFVTAYRIGSGGVSRDFTESVRNVPCRGGNPNYRWQNAIDGGPQSSGGASDSTDCALYKRRYGPVQYDFSGSISYGSPLRLDTDAAANGAVWVPDAWNVVEVYIDYPSQTFKMWHAEYGYPPKLVMSYEGNADIGNRTENYNGAQLLPRLEELAADSSRQDTYAIYDEIIASDDFIPFPGAGLFPPAAPTNLDVD